jgi:hypothetical protein
MCDACSPLRQDFLVIDYSTAREFYKVPPPPTIIFERVIFMPAGLLHTDKFPQDKERHAGNSLSAGRSTRVRRSFNFPLSEHLILLV